MQSEEKNTFTNLPQIKSGQAFRPPSAAQAMCEHLKTFATPMDIFSLNRTIMAEATRIGGCDFSAVAYLDERNSGIKYIQKSNGAFEKKKKRPAWYFKHREPVVVEMGEGEMRFFDSSKGETYREMFLIPLLLGEHSLGFIELYFFRRRSAASQTADALDRLATLARCAVLAMTAAVIRNESLEMSKEYLSGHDLEKKLSANKISLSRATFSAYLNIISGLMSSLCSCEYTGFFLFDKKTLAFRTVSETCERDSANSPETLLKPRAIELIEYAVGRMQVVASNDKSFDSLSSSLKDSGARNFIAAPFMNINHGLGGIVAVNRIVTGRPAEDFGYDDTMATLLLTNYFGNFYDAFQSATLAENRARSLSVIYSISNIGTNFFDSLDFNSAINRALQEISLFMKVFGCAIILEDEGGEHKVFSSVHSPDGTRAPSGEGKTAFDEAGISVPLSKLIRSLNFDYFLSAGPEGEGRMHDSFINLSSVAAFREPVAEFSREFSSAAETSGDFEFILKPIFYSKKTVGYMIFINQTGDNDCRITSEESGEGTVEFMVAATAILTSMIVAHKNYLAMTAMEKYSARMERLASLGEVAAGVAHEIRNPLSGISLFTSSLMSSLPDGDNRKKWVEQISEAVSRIYGLVSNLLNFAREEIVNKRNSDFKTIFDETVTFLSAEISDRKTTVKFIHPENGSEGYFSPEKLKQVLTNLISNALGSFEHSSALNCQSNQAPSMRAERPAPETAAPGTTDALERTIAVILKRDEKKDRSLLYVCDNGQGIAPDIREKIFRPFFTTRSKGTGLGLAITQKIVEAHSGTIRLIDPADIPWLQGFTTVFEVDLPNDGKICYN